MEKLQEIFNESFSSPQRSELGSYQLQGLLNLDISNATLMKDLTVKSHFVYHFNLCLLQEVNGAAFNAVLPAHVRKCSDAGVSCKLQASRPHHG